MSTGSMKWKPKYLGKQKRTSTGSLDAIPWHGQHITVRLDATEFTSHCPVTGQPDFGSVVVEYMPDRHIVETKSFKLYLWSFRDAALFNEMIVDTIATEFFAQVKPFTVTVTGKFNLRGGVGVTATACRVRTIGK